MLQKHGANRNTMSDDLMVFRNMTKNIQCSFEIGFLEKLKSCRNTGEKQELLEKLHISDYMISGGLQTLSEIP
jgi:hypothetical protein